MIRILLAILVLVIAAAPAQARRAHEPATGLAKLQYDAAPPDFRFPLGARTQNLSSLVGKPVVINFWATWCHACIDEFSAFARMEEDYGNRVAFISLSNEPLGVAPAYLKQHGLDLPLLEDPQGAVFAAYSVSVYPVTVVVSARGRVSYVSVGGLDWPELKGALERAF
jgi:thiol-disulfide isomerase/thioredoxin